MCVDDRGVQPRQRRDQTRLRPMRDPMSSLHSQMRRHRRSRPHAAGGRTIAAAAMTQPGPRPCSPAPPVRPHRAVEPWPRPSLRTRPLTGCVPIRDSLAHPSAPAVRTRRPHPRSAPAVRTRGPHPRSAPGTWYRRAMGGAPGLSFAPAMSFGLLLPRLVVDGAWEPGVGVAAGSVRRPYAVPGRLR